MSIVIIDWKVLKKRVPWSRQHVLDLPGKSGGTSDSIITTGGLYDEQAETRIYAGV